MIFLIIIAVIALSIIAWFRAPWALALVIVGTPGYLLKTDIAGIPITLLEAMIVGMMLGWFVRRLATKTLRDAVRTVFAAVPRALWLPSAALMLGWLVSTFMSIDVRASLGAMKAWFIEPTLIGLVALVELNNEKTRTLALRAMLAALSWVSLAGIAQMLFFRSTLQDGRLSSVFAPVANYFAMFAAPLIVIALGMVLMNKDRMLAACAAGLGIVALVLSFSYGGFMAVGAGAIILSVTLLSSSQRRRALTVLVVVAVVGFLALLPTRLFHEKLNFSTRSSSLVRTEIWRKALEIGRQHPLYGIGPNTFEKEYRIVAPTLFHPPLEWLVAKPHNLYLNAWVETGLLGIIGFLWFMTLFLMRLFRSHSTESRIALISGAATVAILVHGLVDTPLFKNDLSVIGGIIVALGLAAASSRTHEEKNYPRVMRGE